MWKKLTLEILTSSRSIMISLLKPETNKWLHKKSKNALATHKLGTDTNNSALASHK